MLTVRLHGHLEEKFGSEFKFEAATVREVIDALQANFDDFTEEFIKDQRAYNILVDAEAQQITGCVVPIKTDSTIDIIPIIGGAGFLKSLGLIIVGAILFSIGQGWALGALANVAGGTGFFAGLAGSIVSLSYVPGALAAISAIGAGLALAGVASLLAGPDGPDGGGPKSSGLSNTENIIGQGMPIPIGYGRLMVGSVVLSATFSSSYIETPSLAWTYENTATGYSEDKQLSYGPPLIIDTPMAAVDGLNIQINYDGGYTPEQWALIIENAEKFLGGGTYQVVNHTTSVGTTTAVPVFKPPRIAGSYIDSNINHR